MQDKDQYIDEYHSAYEVLGCYQPNLLISAGSFLLQPTTYSLVNSHCSLSQRTSELQWHSKHILLSGSASFQVSSPHDHRRKQFLGLDKGTNKAFWFFNMCKSAWVDRDFILAAASSSSYCETRLFRSWTVTTTSLGLLTGCHTSRTRCSPTLCLIA